MSDRPTVLIIEDDEDTRANLTDILELDDFAVATAGRFSEALQRTDWASIFAIVLDRRLPDGQAEEVLPRIKRLAPDAAVLIVTGHADLDGAIAALREGVEDYILKPVNADALRITLSRIRSRRQLANEKRRSESAFRHLVEVAGSLIVLLRPDGRIAYFNPFAEQLTGYRLDDLKGRDYFELCLPADRREEVRREFLKILSGKRTRGYENVVQCRDGSLRWVSWNAQLLEDFDGAPAVLGIGQDITDRKQAVERALQSERLAAIGQTVAGLAHESRNAFQRSQACLELLGMELEGRPQELELVARIQRALDHLHRLYEEVRDYAAPIKLDRQLCELAHLWRDAWAHLEIVRRQREVVLQESESAGPFVCHADWFALGQVFRNVFENAIAACPPAGQITVEARSARLDGQAAVVISIRDNGPGIPPDVRDQVFDAFFTTKTKGTGLGMAIARRIVEAHGGRIEVGSPPTGAEFLITLPCSG